MSSTRTRTHTSTLSGTLSVKAERGPIKKTYATLGHALDAYPSKRVNPILGQCFTDALQLKHILGLPAAERDPVLRDLAITISRRGFVTIKAQHALTNDDLAQLALHFNRLTGKPSDSGLHVHPLSQKDFNEDGSPKFKGEQITNDRDARGARISGAPEDDQSQFASENWHTDISFEPIPASYTLLRMNVVPECGGDTMFLSSYEAFDRLSKPMQTMLEGLTATHDGKVFVDQAKKFGFDLYTDPRGTPANQGSNLAASHPVIRTDPVTGWKALHVNRTFTTRINELSYDESATMLDFLHRHKAMNHNMMARVSWEAGDLCMWSNSAVEHAATFDYAEGTRRTGDRAVAVGERPFLDANSTGRRQALQLEEDATVFA